VCCPAITITITIGIGLGLGLALWLEQCPSFSISLVRSGKTIPDQILTGPQHEVSKNGTG
jgi:hypothetical protein